MKKVLFYCTLVWSMLCCSPKNTDVQMATWKAEIIQAETDFCALAQTDGIPKAFLTYAADDAVLNRRNHLYIGIDSIKVFHSDTSRNPNIRLTWKPDFVDVAASGDLGYTYGQYVYAQLDSVGQVSSSNTGVFHTVWKRQEDGQWKFVWD
jgi:ketosteroid isomerase-like protein